jgi:magnesium transporter
MQKLYYRTVRDEKLNEVAKAKRGSWLHVVAPDDNELEQLEREYGFDADLLNDSVDIYESPRLEHENGYTYIYVRYCRPDSEETSTEPLLLIMTPDLLVTVARRSAEPIEQILSAGEIVTTQKVKLLLQILQGVNEGYRLHLNRVTKQIFASRRRLQKTIVKNDDVLRFIDTEEDLNEFLAALQPYGILLQALISGRYFTMHNDDQDLIEDIQLSTNELIELTKGRLNTVQNIREAHATIATNNLNMIFKRLTSIAIFMAVPTIIGGLYGMNLALPFDDHPQAFFIVLGIITLFISIFVWIFSRKRWL